LQQAIGQEAHVRSDLLRLNYFSGDVGGTLGAVLTEQTARQE
jgi:hypothetical protein